MKNIKRILNDAALRVKMTFESHFMFFHIYFGHYIEFDTADFQKEMFRLTENFKNLVIVAFRGSGKSTIMNMSLPLWAIMGKPQCKYLLIVGQTQEQAKQHLKNIKQELENNELLKRDLGPFKEIENDWSAYTIEIPNFNARISAISIDQSIRGSRHGAHRPDLIICDDIEDMNSVRTLESRDRVDEFITSELIPAGTAKTKMVVIGNLLHEDSLVMRFKKRIESKEFEGVFKEYPLMDEDSNCLWPGKFPKMEDVEREKRRIGKSSAFQREYMLKIVTDYERVIPREWIQTYSGPPPDTVEDLNYRYTITGIDLAISQNEKADYTAMVSARVFGYKDKMLIYILPNPINKRLTFGATLDIAEEIFRRDGKSLLVVEDVAYQKAALQQLIERGCKVKGFTPRGDKTSRLSLISHLVQRGQILFPEKGVEKLVQQLINFELERHDDLVDAFVTAITHASTEKHARLVFYPIDF
jgi:predicted phage terminase large subunit-like protein